MALPSFFQNRMQRPLRSRQQLGSMDPPSAGCTISVRVGNSAGCTISVRVGKGAMHCKQPDVRLVQPACALWR